MPAIFQASLEKFAGKRFERVASKKHPMELLYARFCTVALVRCRDCGTHWQVDSWNRRVGYCAWPEVAIRIGRREGWEQFDDLAQRRDFFPEMERGVVHPGNTVRKCPTPKCKDYAVVGLEHCANCASRARHLH
jgi:hypothetical protein